MRRLGQQRLLEIDDLTRTYLAGREGLEAVDRAALVARVQAGEVTVLDVRPADEYRAGHLPGAISLPLDELERRLDALPRGRDVVAYCRGPYCLLAVRAVEVLRGRGFAAYRLEDGVPDWRARGLAVDSVEGAQP